MENHVNVCEAIFAVVNVGFASIAMDAAKEAGAHGGTILHGRGTGSKQVEKKYGIVITPEKEILIILALKENVDKVLSAIYKAAGIDTPGHGICFTLPATNVVGLKYEKL